MSYQAEYDRLANLITEWKVRLDADARFLGNGHSRSGYLLDGKVYKLPHGVENIDQNLSEAYQWQSWAHGLAMKRPCRPIRCRMVDEVVLEAEFITDIWHENDAPAHVLPSGMPMQDQFGLGSDCFHGGLDASGQWVQIDCGMYECKTRPHLLCKTVWLRGQQDYTWPNYFDYAQWCGAQDKISRFSITVDPEVGF